MKLHKKGNINYTDSTINTNYFKMIFKSILGNTDLNTNYKCNLCKFNITVSHLDLHLY